MCVCVCVCIRDVIQNRHSYATYSPSSSRRTREWGVACCRMVDVSLSSTKNVLSPLIIRSEAPSLVKSRSTGVSSQLTAGT